MNLSESDEEDSVDPAPLPTPAEYASAEWFGYIGFAIVVVSLALPFVIAGLVIYWYFHGRT